MNSKFHILVSECDDHKWTSLGCCLKLVQWHEWRWFYASRCPCQASNILLLSLCFTLSWVQLTGKEYCTSWLVDCSRHPLYRCDRRVFKFDVIAQFEKRQLCFILHTAITQGQLIFKHELVVIFNVYGQVSRLRTMLFVWYLQRVCCSTKIE